MRRVGWQVTLFIRNTSCLPSLQRAPRASAIVLCGQKLHSEMSGTVLPQYDGNTVNVFLKASRAALASTTLSVKSKIFLGNEACDLDSVACALALAYSEHTGDMAALPVLNIPRSELSLRRDVVCALELTGIDSALLTFADDADMLSLVRRGWGLTLVDHNELATHQTALAAHVTRIVDHHADSGEISAAQRTMRPTGSCASLVSSEIGDDSRIPPPLAYMLLSAVLADTHCLERRTVAEDEKAARRLAEIAKVSRYGWNRITKAISEQRAQVDGFTARELLLMDYKCFAGELGRAGISSVNEGLATWTAGADDRRLTSKVLKDMTKKKRVDAMLVMSSFHRDGQFCRELLIFGESHAARLLRQRLPNRDNMVLRPIKVPGLPDGHCFAQENLEASRKVTAPQVKAVLNRG